MRARHQYSLEDIEITEPAWLTIGVFDGVHRGHQRLVEALVSEAHSKNRLAIVLTFFPHPDVVLKGITGRYYLMSPEQRAEYLLNLGVDFVITQPFDDQVRRMPALQFVKRLVDRLKMAELWVGADFALGHKREGNIEFLRQQGMLQGFAVRTVDLVEHDESGLVINSTTLREWLREGRVEQVRHWLGRAYSVTGIVEHGQKRGRTIGFPTANLKIWSEQIVPANGVYAGWATVDGQRFMALTNVGIRPTFAEQDITIESYLLDFSGDLYGRTIHLSFEARLRDEQRFNGVEALVRQIELDVVAGRGVLTQQAQSSSPGLGAR